MMRAPKLLEAFLARSLAVVFFTFIVFSYLHYFWIVLNERLLYKSRHRFWGKISYEDQWSCGREKALNGKRGIGRGERIRTSGLLVPNQAL